MTPKPCTVNPAPGRGDTAANPVAHILSDYMLISSDGGASGTGASDPAASVRASSTRQLLAESGGAASEGPTATPAPGGGSIRWLRTAKDMEALVGRYSTLSLVMEL